MNQIQEMDWAEDCWHGHTGMDSTNDYCVVDEKKTSKGEAEPEEQEKKPSEK